MKILHLVASLDTGGAERQLYLLCSNTHHLYSHSVVAAGKPGVWSQALERTGVRVDHMGCSNFLDPRLIAGVASAIASQRPDVLHCWLPSMNLAGALAARLSPAAIPVIAGIRNVDDWKPWLYRCADRLTAPLWSGIICNSRAGLELSIRRGLPASKLHLVPNGLETQPPVTDSERTQARLSLGVTAGDFVLVTAARLVRHKRVEACIDVAARLPGVRLFIAGDGPMRGELEDRARALGLAGRVAFTGTLDSLRRLLAAGDVFILCSEREGTSNALLEAMQCGCVPLTTDAGDNRHIVPRTEWILPPDQMAAAILKMASQKGLFNSLREEARKAAGRYSIEAMVAGTLKVYHRVQPVTHLRPACGEVG